MRKIFLTLGTIVVIIVGFYLFNYATIVLPTSSKLNIDSRNEGIIVDVHYKNYFLFNTLVFNLKTIPIDKAPADVFRVLLQTSAALKDKKFNNIELEFKGSTKFKLNGDYFGQLGSEYEEQNPMYTMRTFSENLYFPNGEEAYSKWEGGILGVLNKQMDDFNDFNKKWYLDELIGEVE
jgi:hypothetical protein